MRSPDDPIVRATARDPRILARFWTSVDRGDQSTEACWEWQGPEGYGAYPLFRVKHRAVSAARVAWFTATGEFPLSGRLRRTCQNPRCVRPEHMEWELGRRTEHMLQAMCGSYVPVATVRSVATGNDTRLRRAG
jgi:hypothetical protein